jgi:hypothetical protein
MAAAPCPSGPWSCRRKTTSGYLNATLQHLLDSMRRFGSGGQSLHDVAHDEKSERPPDAQPSALDARNAVVN